MLHRKFVSGFILIFASFSLCIFISNVMAIVPQIQDITVLENGDDTLLEVTFFHNPVNAAHYVNEIEVDVNGVFTTYPISQDSTTFTARLNLGQISGTQPARVRVYCTFDGWSSWSNQQTIPEFQSLMVISLLLSVCCLFVLRFRKKLIGATSAIN